MRGGPARTAQAAGGGGTPQLKETHHYGGCTLGSATLSTLPLSSRSPFAHTPAAHLRSERAALEARLREQLDAAAVRAGEAEREARGLREHKAALDARVSELASRLGAAEGSNR